MFSATEIKTLTRRRARILVPAMAIGVFALFATLAIASLARDPFVDFVRQHMGNTASEVAPIGLFLPSLAFFLLPLVWAERKSKSFALICPQCEADLSRSTARVLATRCCKSCGTRIVEGGRTRGPEVFDRYSRLKQRRFLVYWFWSWPVLGTLVLLWDSFDPSALANCVQALLVPGLIGTVATAWAFARTVDSRYLPQLGASALVLWIGGERFWNTFW